ncbi:DNA methylase [Litoreibacter roseus]|uniref:DNA methylase n=2 Tax=Litoreibacter roseus TaxID=2601869 RepID=A0A6N6JG55_9RHOB|nr:DNA methylase [Litoreibacter roseus]
MNLFETADQVPDNLLPQDGTVHYYGPMMDLATADRYFDLLLQSIDWQNDEAMIFGKKIVTKRKVAWYADKPFSYTYSKLTKTAHLWTPDLLKLKSLVENHCGERFNSCLLNLYHDGSEGMAWHSDGERDLKRNGAIGSLSLGAARKFAFKHKRTGQTVSRTLEHGALLVMKDETQSHWLHRLPPTKRVHDARINLTFRTIDERT